MNNNQFIFTLCWYNGYYRVCRKVLAYSEEEAIKKVKEKYKDSEVPQSFRAGENPPINCGLYDEPEIVDIKS